MENNPLIKELRNKLQSIKDNNSIIQVSEPIDSVVLGIDGVQYYYDLQIDNVNDCMSFLLDYIKEQNLDISNINVDTLQEIIEIIFEDGVSPCDNGFILANNIVRIE